jgi:hypothetical protein
MGQDKQDKKQQLNDDYIHALDTGQNGPFAGGTVIVVVAVKIVIVQDRA